MPTVHIHESTSVPPDRFVAALTDFGPGRDEIFRNSHAKVHESGDTWADVTEGASVGWERLRYDWSQPNVVRLTTTDSNAWSTDSNWVYTLAPRADGGTDIDLVVARKGRNARAWLGAGLMAVGGKSLVRGDLRRSIKAIEAAGPVRGRP
jgi:hypothetical protein